MKKLLSLLFFVVPFLSFSQEKGLDKRIDEAFAPISDFFSSSKFLSRFLLFATKGPGATSWLIPSSVFHRVDMFCLLHQKYTFGRYRRFQLFSVLITCEQPPRHFLRHITRISITPPPHILTLTAKRFSILSILRAIARLLTASWDFGTRVLLSASANSKATPKPY